MRAPLARRLGELIARDPLFARALAAGGGLRLLAMVAHPGALWFSGDSYVYLGAALRPRPDLSKTTGYSLFLRGLEPFHSLTLVTGVQHLMGLGVAVMIYLLLRRTGVSQRWATAATLPANVSRSWSPCWRLVQPWRTSTAERSVVTLASSIFACACASAA